MPIDMFYSDPHMSHSRVAFEAFQFPGGEYHVKISGPIAKHRIAIHSRGTDLMPLALAADAVHRNGGVPSAVIPYFPYARQDRQCVYGEPLSCAVAADFVNSMQLESVTVLDPHSDVLPALLDRCKAVSNRGFVEQVLKDFAVPNLALVAPDTGATKKVAKLGRELHIPWFQGMKHRDLATGKLSGFSFMGSVKDKHLIIVDDICDGGGTFTGLARRLLEGKAASVHLAVTHGIFSKGLPLEHIDTVYSTNSYPHSVTPGTHGYREIDYLDCMTGSLPSRKESYEPAVANGCV